MKEIGLGIYGDNGHQVYIEDYDETDRQGRVKIYGYAACEEHPEWPDATEYNGLDDMLSDPRISLISLCSPKRANQAKDAVKCLKAGKHVYAEKPCALTEEELDLIIKTAAETGLQFHEMAGTTFQQPYAAMKELVADGVIGDVVQVFAQKSYPACFDWRPADEDIDGGLIRQVAVHAFRMVEQVTGLKITACKAVETSKGSEGDCAGMHMASSFILTLEDGAVASVLANYLNPRDGFGNHANEHLRVFGTKGFIESVHNGDDTRVCLTNKDLGSFDTTAKMKTYFELFIDSLCGEGAMPLSLEDELHPTRWVIRAKESAYK